MTGAAFLGEAVKGLKAQVVADGRLLPGLLTLGRELIGIVGYAPHGWRCASLYRQLERWDDSPTHPLRHPPRWGVRLHPSQRYGQAARATCDVYVPATAGRATDGGAPVVLFTHGGVWASGEPWHYVHLSTTLAQRGCVVFCHTYTLYPDAQVPQMVQEVSAALTWALDNAARYGGDPSRLTVIGHSAGAHLLALALMQRAGLPVGETAQRLFPRSAPAGGDSACTDPTSQLAPTHDDPRMPACFVGLSGVYNIARHYEHERSRGVHFLSMMARAMGGAARFSTLSPACILHALSPSAAPQSSSTKAALRRLPPCYIGGGLADYVVPWGEGEEMAVALKSCEVRVTPLVYHGADHASFVMDWTPHPAPDPVSGAGAAGGKGGDKPWVQDVWVIVQAAQNGFAGLLAHGQLCGVTTPMPNVQSRL